MDYLTRRIVSRKTGIRIFGTVFLLSASMLELFESAWGETRRGSLSAWRRTPRHRVILPVIFDNPLDRGIQRFRVDWLDQVFQKTGFLALRQIAVRAEAAHRDAP